MRKLEGIIAATDKEAMAFCLMELSEMEYVVFTDDVNYIFAVPRTELVTPILYMAHIDTRRKKDAVVLARHGDTVLNTNGVECGCLGADDRAGVYIVLELARKLENKPYILLTTGEESGYTGATAFIKDMHPDVDFIDEEHTKGKKIWEPYIDDLYTVIQFDRKGMNEAAFYGTSQFSETLMDMVESLGYTLYTNSSSDSKVVQEALGIAGCNLSCGYSKNHTADELLILPAIPFAIRQGIYLAALVDERIPLPQPKAVQNYPPIANFHPLPPKPDANPKYQGVSTECDICGKKRPLTYIPNAIACVCKKCINRAGGESYFDVYYVEEMRKQLEEERDRSRLANRPVADPCPLCFETHDLSPQRDDVLYCKKCMTYFLPQMDRVYFWSDKDDKHIFYRNYDDPVTIHDMTDPVGFIPLEWCHVCGHVHHRNSTTNYDGFIVCLDCDAIRQPK